MKSGRIGASVALLLGSIAPLAAYTFTGSRWSTSTIRMQLQLGAATTPLSDGRASWGESAADALATWNTHLGTTQFTAVPDSTVPQAQGNRYNNVFFSKTVYGQSWGSGVLAVALTYTSGGSQSVECDVLFNQNLRWDSYRGSTRYGSGTVIYDFHRVALHEFGHVLGLDHPDQDGQSVTAIMNSRITGLDSLTADDIAGAQSLYGASTPAVTAPAITSQPASQSVTEGASATFAVTATSSTTPSYQWRKDGAPLAGATRSTLTIANVTANAAGNYTVVVSNSGGSVTSRTAVLSVTRVTTSAPTIVSSPSAQTVSTGERIALSVSVTGTPTPSIQWQKNGVNIAGATSATLLITSAAPGDSGTYAAVVTNSAGSVATVPVLVTVKFSQLVNLSTRGFVPAGGALTAGFVLRGVSDKPLIVRGVGPALSSYGVTNALVNPRLSVISQSTSQTLAVNDTWGTVPQLSTDFQNVGAFPLPSGSADSASNIRLPSGGYTARVTADASNAAGIALAEVYDAEPASYRCRLVNLSTRGFAGAGDSALVAGFSVQGNAPKRVLIRAVGPSLAAYGVTSILANPQFQVFVQGEATAFVANDDWSGTTELKTLMAQAGAFPLNDGSRDAALVQILQPGTYTVVVTGVGATTGNVLVEIYDLDP